MATETKEQFTRIFDSLADNARAAMDTGRRANEVFFKAAGEAWKNQTGYDWAAARAERFAGAFGPFMGKSIESTAHLVDTGFRKGMDLMKAARDVSVQADRQDFYATTRTLWDATFAAARDGFEAWSRAGTEAVENWTEWCRSSFAEQTERVPTKGKP